jgi:hypothetical protein
MKKHLLFPFFTLILVFFTYSARGMVEMRSKAPNTEGVLKSHKPTFIERFLLKRFQKQGAKKQKTVFLTFRNAEPTCDTIFTTTNQIIVAQIVAVTDVEITYLPCGGKGEKKWLSTLDVREMKSTKFKLLDNTQQVSSQTTKDKTVKDGNDTDGKQSLTYARLGLLFPFTLILSLLIKLRFISSIFFLTVLPLVGLILSIMAINKGLKADRNSRLGRRGIVLGILGTVISLMFLIFVLLLVLTYGI